MLSLIQIWKKGGSLVFLVSIRHNELQYMFRKINRSSFNHNITKLFEGFTNSYASYDLESIKPFKPFARDSEGGLMTLFYTANLDAGTGDIIIDCSYTRLYLVQI